MDNLERSIALQRRSLERFLRVLAAGSDEARLFEAPGVVASTVPAAATRSVANSVVYEDAERLAAELERLAEHFEAFGIEAWTVWVPEGDRAAAELLESAGHRLDADPAAMELELADVEGAPPDAGSLEWDTEVGGAEVGRLNDSAYGLTERAFEPAYAKAGTGDGLRLYRTRVGGESASVLATVDVDDDCGIYLVATDPGHRGHGLATELLRAALLEARERGLSTSSLQSSKLGQPVYERLGYRSTFTLEMWERRKR